MKTQQGSEPNESLQTVTTLKELRAIPALKNWTDEQLTELLRVIKVYTHLIYAAVSQGVSGPMDSKQG